MSIIKVLRGEVITCATCGATETVPYKNILPFLWVVLRENGSDNAYCPNCDGAALAKYNPSTEKVTA